MLSFEEENALLKQTLEALRKENRCIVEKSKVYFNHSDLGFVILNPSQEIVEVNKTFEDLFGYSGQELEGEPFSKLFTTPQLYQTWCANYIRFDSFSSVSNLEYRLMKKNKIIFWAELFGQKFEENGLEFTIWSIRDISLRVHSRNTIRNLNAKLHKQFEELQEILDIIPLPIFIDDKEFRFAGCNKAFCEFFSIDKTDVLGKTVFDIFPYDDAVIYHEKNKEMIHASYQIYKTKIMRKDGQEVAFEIQKKRIMREGEFDGFVGILIDITQIQEQEQYLQNRVQEELSKNLLIQERHQAEMISHAKFSSIGQMAAGITHEINTPLTYVKGNFEMLLDDLSKAVSEPLRSQMLEDGQVIYEGLERIERIIKTMREASGKSSELQEPINLYETIISSLILSHNRAKQVVKVYVDGKPFHTGFLANSRSIPCYLQKQRIEQVWVIAINNALDELVKIEHFENRHLNILTKITQEEAIVLICDNAGGIDDTILPYIFEPFQSTKESSGIGIGLNIAHGIVTQNGGSIRAYNDTKGAVIEVRFPLHKES